MNETSGIDTERTTSKRRLRFTIAGLLFLMLCIAGLLAGYRIGYRQGYVSGDKQRQSEKPFVKVYAVHNLVLPRGADPSRPNYDSLIELLSSTIAPETWEEVGGPGVLQGFEANHTLVVRQTRENHDKIAELLEQLRRIRADAGAEDSGPSSPATKQSVE